MPDWRDLYEAVKVETNLNLLELLMDDAELAMWRRLRELDADGNGAAERHEIEQASQEFLALRTKKLGWPTPFELPE
jgi:hypothetical protein